MLEEFVELMTLELELYTDNIEFTEFLYIWVNIRLGISKIFVLSEITSDNVVIVILEYLGMEIINGLYIDFIVEKKEARRVS